MSYTPAELAFADQHFAKVRETLDMMLCLYRAASTGDPVQDMVYLINNFMSDEVEQVASHTEHVGTLANLLAVAIERLSGR